MFARIERDPPADTGPPLALRLFGGLSLHGPDGPVSGRAAQRRRQSLLALLADAPGATLSRDKLIAYLWPESDTAAARHLLSDSLYVLRKELGEGVLEAAGDEVRLNEDLIRVDVREFERDLARGALDRAVGLYVGPFLDGVFLKDAPEFERWAEDGRRRYSRRYADALERLARAAEADGDVRSATRWWRLLVEHTPTSERPVAALVRCLAAGGDPALALEAADAYEHRMREDLGVEPSPKVRHAAQLDVPPASTAPATVASAARLQLDRKNPAHEETDSPTAARQSAGDTAHVRRRARDVVRSVTALAVLSIILALAVHLSRSQVRSAGLEGAAAHYEEGLRHYAAGSMTTAVESFTRALEEDPRMFMAAYHAGLAMVVPDIYEARTWLARAVRLAERYGDERERLFIRAAWTNLHHQEAREESALRLLESYPDEPGGYYFLGRDVLWSGDFLGAIPLLRRAVELDSAAMADSDAGCTGCDAYREIIAAYLRADSTAAGERVAREWIARRPSSAMARMWLAFTLRDQHRFEEALASHAEAMPLAWGDVRPHWQTFPAEVYMAAGEFREADLLLERLAADPSPAVRREALWFLVISLRNQGRLREALDVARVYRKLTDATAKTEAAAHPIAVFPEAQVRFEMGHHIRSAELFDSLRLRSDAPEIRSQDARHRVWMMTHVATALTAAGDTAGLHQLAERMERVGRHSGFGRDPLLHRYARGLLLAARGDHQAAVDEFRGAIFSRTIGYSRVNIELARSLLALDRADEATEIVRRPLFASSEGSNYYATYSELHLLLGDAHLAAGRPDSALAHYTWTLRAWERADAEHLGAEADRVRALVDRLLAPQGE